MIFDKDELDARTFGDEELMQELLMEFLTTFPDQFEALNQALNAGRTKEMTTLAHTIKGTSANLAAKAMANAALAIEEAGRENTLDDAPTFIENLKIEFETFKKTMTELGYDQ
jgi:HPt (histidine-containing phosphotransfer) domain-containing protein